MHRIFLTAGLVFSALALVIFFSVISDVYEGNHNGNREYEIKPAPIHEVDVMIAESYPEQIFVYIKGGLSDGCTTFKDIQTEINGNIINITVTVQRPKDAMCAQVYGYFEQNVALGSDFIRGETYTVNVNGTTTSFTYPQYEINDDMVISLAPIHEVEISIGKSNPEQVLVYIKGGLADSCTSLNDSQTQIIGNTINITVTVQRPENAMCAQVYGYFEENIALGSDFIRGETYTVNVNGITAGFTYLL